MSSLDDYWCDHMRRNRALHIKECEEIRKWYDVSHPAPKGSSDRWTLHKQRVDWCELNTTELWTTVRRNNTFMVFRFTSLHDSLMFKLVHGGSAPPKRYLP